MTYLFICSSLEVGRDGVGDYTKILAVGLCRRGHNVSLVSLHDKHISVISRTKLVENNMSIDFLRIPNNISSGQRFRLLNDWINLKNPNLISLQYSGFGFHRYGLPWYIVRDFRQFAKKCNIHIMFHELWCGVASNSSVKEKVLGSIQLVFIKILILAIKPKIVFTSILPYVNSLKLIGVNSKSIPIFGTIDLNEMGEDVDWATFKERYNLSSLAYDTKQWLIVGFFGTIYPRTGLDKILQLCSDVAIQSNKKFGVVTFGTNRGVDIGTIMSGNLVDQYWSLGSLPVPMINRIVKLVNLGIVTSTADCIDKSTTAKAWLERSIPIIVSADDKSYIKEQMVPKGIFQAACKTEVVKAFNSKLSLNVTDSLYNTVMAYESLVKSKPL